MNGKVVIVTGATNGIGEVTALELARKGATVVAISRNETKLQNTVAMIKRETGNDAVSYIQADLSSLEQITRAADDFLAQFDRLDVLVNNAGIFLTEYQASVDGIEMMLALNHFNYFLLTNRLLDTLKSTGEQYGEARIVNVSSAAHNTANIDFDMLDATDFSSFSRYGETKLMNLLFSYALSRRLENTNVTVNALHPGFVDTGIGKGNQGVMAKIIGIIQKIIAISPEEGARTNIYLASSPNVKNTTATYWSKMKRTSSNKVSYDEALQERLWDYSESMIQELLAVEL